MSFSEDIRALNRLCDTHAEKFAGSVHGRFPAEEIRSDVLSFRAQGLIRMKTLEEIKADCAKIDREQASEKRRRDRFVNQFGRGGVGRKGYTKPQKRKLLEAVEQEMDLGYGIREACRIVGIDSKTYHKFREDLGLPKKSFKKGPRT